MFVNTPNFSALCPVPEEWNGADTLHSPTSRMGRDAIVPAPPHAFSSAPAAPRTETDRCLHRSYVLVEKLRRAVLV